MTRRARTALGAGLTLGLLALLAAGCDLFKPATPEMGSGGNTLLPSYASPESCLRYMRIGVESKDNAGQDAYLGALADVDKDGVGFHAFFDQAVWNATPPEIRPADWDLQHEYQFFGVFIRSYGDPYHMYWLPDEVFPHDTDYGDSMLVHRRYEVWAMRKATSDSLLIAVGYADLHFVRISAARWALAVWEDRVAAPPGFPPIDPDQQTFGYRRLNAGAGG